MARAMLLLLMVSLLVAGCGGSDGDAPGTTTAPAPAPVTTQTQPAAGDENLIDVSSLLGKPLAGEPECVFNDRFEAVREDGEPYDGSLGLGIVCGGASSTGQILNLREPAGKTRIAEQNLSCSRTETGSVCRVAPSATVGMYFTGADENTAKRRLQRLAAVVRALPPGASPQTGAASPR